MKEMVLSVTVYKQGSLHTDRLDVNRPHYKRMTFCDNKIKHVTLDRTNFAMKTVKVTMEEWEKNT